LIHYFSYHDILVGQLISRAQFGLFESMQTFNTWSWHA